MCEDNCGIGGECVSGGCVCIKGWRQSREFTFFQEQTLTEASLLKCDINEPIIKILYSLSFITCIVVLILYLLAVKKRSQAKRLIPFWLVCSIVSGFNVVKLMDVNFEQEIGVDVGITVVPAIILLLFYVNLFVFLNKYFQYHNKTFATKSEYTLKIIKIVSRIGYFVLSLQFVATLLFMSVPVVESISPLDLDNITENDLETEELKAGLMKTSFALFLLGAFYQLVAGWYLLNELGRDINIIIKQQNAPVKMKARAHNTKTGVRLLIMFCVSFSMIHIVFFLIPLISTDLMRLWKYIYPSITITGISSSAFILYATKRARGRQKKQKAGLSKLLISIPNSTLIEDEKPNPNQGSFEEAL